MTNFREVCRRRHCGKRDGWVRVCRWEETVRVERRSLRNYHHRVFRFSLPIRTLVEGEIEPPHTTRTSTSFAAGQQMRGTTIREVIVVTLFGFSHTYIHG